MPTAENVADIFTKALPRPKFESFVERLGLATMGEEGKKKIKDIKRAWFFDDKESYVISRTFNLCLRVAKDFVNKQTTPFPTQRCIECDMSHSHHFDVMLRLLWVLEFLTSQISLEGPL